MLRCADLLPHGKGPWVAVSQLPPAPPAALQPDTLLWRPTCVLQVPDSLGSGLQLRAPALGAAVLGVMAVTQSPGDPGKRVLGAWGEDRVTRSR